MKTVFWDSTAKILINIIYGCIALFILSVIGLIVWARWLATPFRIRVRSNRLVEWRDQGGEWQSYTVYAPNRQGVKRALKDLWTVMRERFLPFTG